MVHIPVVSAFRKQQRTLGKAGVLLVVLSMCFWSFVTFVSADQVVPISDCAILNQADTEYVLQNDVSADGTCFSVQANNITINLNGHTVTYGNAPTVVVPNGDFETGDASDWDLSQAPAASVLPGTFVDPTTLWSGDYSLRFVSPAGAQYITTSAPLTLGADRTFYASVMVSNALADVVAYVQILDADTQSELSRAQVGNTNQFGVLQTSYKPDEAIEVLLRIGIEGAGINGSGTVFLDDIHVAPEVDHGVAALACWSNGVAENPCGGTAEGLVVKDGSIIQGTANAQSGHGIRVGQINGSDNIEVSNTEIRVHGLGAKNISIQASNVWVHDNTLYNDVTTIINRHAMQGMAINIENGSAHRVHHNTIIGGVQGGIMVTGGVGSEIHHNDISQNARYTNDFSISAWAPGIKVYDNYVHPMSGRGISVIKYSSEIYNNTVEVRELRQNQEYGGCQSGGTYGIQLEESGWSGPNYDNLIHNNTITAYADECDGIAFRVTSLDNEGSSEVYDNTFNAVRVGSTTKAAIAASLLANDGGFDAHDNQFIADSYHIYNYWDGTINSLFTSNSFLVGNNPAAGRYTLFFNNAYPVTLTILDGDFQSGTSPTDAFMKVDSGPNAGPTDYYIQWTLTADIKDGADNPVSGASISVVNTATDEEVYAGVIVGSQIAIPLTQLHVYNTTTQAQNIDDISDYEVTVTRDEYEPATQIITMDAAKIQTFTLAPETSLPPILTSIGHKNIHEQDSFSFNVLATDANDDPLSLSATNLPTGAMFTDNEDGTGTFTWTPTASQSGTYPNIHFEVTDGNLTDSEDITITVQDGAADCSPNWTCSSWSACSNSTQTRTCTDQQVCGTDAGKPATTQGCDSTPPGRILDLTL